MHFYKALTIGTHHTHHCEDYLFYEKSGEHRWTLAVLDGCSMGNDSYFASALAGKILRKTAREQYSLDFVQPGRRSPVEELQFYFKSLFEALGQSQNLIGLDKYDLLTTVVLMVIDEKENAGAVMTVGDGVVAINGTITEYDQQNQPDYLGYHLGEDFEEWFAKQQQVLTFNALNDISICTDGLLTFDRFDHRPYPEQIDPVHYLLFDKENAASELMLHQKLMHLEQNCGLRPTDDFGMIRVINGAEY